MDSSHMQKFEFTKMHGLGNDYIYFDCTKFEFPAPEKAAKILSNRNFSIGGDGIVLIEKPTDKSDLSSALYISNDEFPDFKMRMFNADGSEAEMCGNAVRCIAKFIYDKGLSNKSVIKLETLAGLIILHSNIENNSVIDVRVNMGKSITEPPQIPCAFTDSPPINQKLEIDGEIFTGTAVSMGNPHFVIFVDEITDYHVLIIGPKIEKHPAFLKKTNVEFVKINSPTHATMRVWERGSGETLACGTGACAVVVAGNLLGLLEKSTKVSLKGGDLKIDITENGDVFKTGPATTSFEGVVGRIW